LIVPVFPALIAEKLREMYGFYDWEKLGDKTAVRMLTSWATPESKVDEFVSDLKSIS
jgi:threonine aldolase